MGSLFEPAAPGQWRRNAVADHYHENLGVVSAGYQRAAEMLVEAWEAERFDPLLLPIVLLYRHGLELQLKHAITVTERALREVGQPGRTPTELDAWFKRKAGHRLKALRDELSRQLRDLGVQQPLDTDVSDAIDELADFDPWGETFRYTTTLEKDKATGATQSVRNPRPGDPAKGAVVDVVALGAKLDTAINHIGDVWSHVEATYLP